jgi:membrane-associated phospholipid phosphatase
LQKTGAFQVLAGTLWREADGRDIVSATPQSDNQTLAQPPSTETVIFRGLLRRSLIILFLCAGLVTVASFFVDKPVAYCVSDCQINRFKVFNEYELLKWLTYSPIVLEAAAPLMIVLAVLLLAWRPLPRFERTLFAAAVNLLITLVLKDHLKFVFGRYWPDTWLHPPNPSLLRDGAYGFHLFHSGMAYASFPSGHTARIFSFLTVVWVAYPRWRWLCLVWYATVIIGLVGMNYHFVGDVIGGAGLGWITGMYAAHFFGLDPSTKDGPVLNGRGSPAP